MKTTILEKIPGINGNDTNSRNQLSWRRGLLLISLLSVSFALLPTVQATPEEGPAAPRAPQKAATGPEIPEGAPAILGAPLAPLPGFNTADGQDALVNVTTGSGNSAFGWRALFSNTDASFNTGVGVGALVLNNGDSNTAVGAAALLLNTSGTNNTGIGTDALVFNDTGNNNTAVGAFALFDNTTGAENTAVGSSALPNSTASDNTAVGLFALLNTWAVAATPQSVSPHSGTMYPGPTTKPLAGEHSGSVRVATTSASAATLA